MAAVTAAVIAPAVAALVSSVVTIAMPMLVTTPAVSIMATVVRTMVMAMVAAIIMSAVSIVTMVTVVMTVPGWRRATVMRMAVIHRPRRVVAVMLHNRIVIAVIHHAGHAEADAHVDIGGVGRNRRCAQRQRKNSG